MTKTIEITVSTDVECTEEEFKEWVEYSLGYSSQIKIANPLSDEPFEASSVHIF